MAIGHHARLFLFAVAIVAAGCVPLAPQRDEAPATSLRSSFGDSKNLTCNPEISRDSPRLGIVDGDGCKKKIREDSAKYNLYFAEYDDQGWSYEDDAARDPAQIFSRQLHDLIKDDFGEKISVVVFVHGWKHNAGAEDSNVRLFRVLLNDLSGVEEQSACGLAGSKRRVIGLYVGWRGKTGELGPLENATFWNRKEAAQRVALGDVRMLFSDLREIQEKANAKWNADIARISRISDQRELKDKLDPCGKRMKLAIAGHSFGGLIVYTSIAQSLVRDIVAVKHDNLASAGMPTEKRIQPLLQRQGDLIVVINPAIEAARLHPLFRAAQIANLNRYYSPAFISITSKADTATRRAFPVGRWLSTFWDRYPPNRHDLQKEANLYTFGHARSFVTHELKVVKREEMNATERCAGWSKEQSFETKLKLESDNLADFRARLREHQNDASRIESRYFCGIEPMQLSLSKDTRDWAGNSPIWNISADESVMENHNDFMNPQLLELLRQLYIETDEQISGPSRRPEVLKASP